MKPKNKGKASIAFKLAVISLLGADVASRFYKTESIPDMIQRVLPTVVHIETQNNNLTGTGFIIDSRGYIATVYHVASPGDSSIRVTLQNGEFYAGKVIGGDEKLDLSVIKIDAGRPLPVVQWGKSDDMRPGDIVIGIGGPYGLAFSVSEGIISGSHRKLYDNDLSVSLEENFVQSTHALNPGNSGGPLFNVKGKVIGVANSIVNENSDGFAGIALSAPSEYARKVYRDIIAYGTFCSGDLGVVMADRSGDKYEPEDNLPPPKRYYGVEVVDVPPGTEAAKGGIKKGDITTGFNGREIPKLNHLMYSLLLTRPGEGYHMTVSRFGKTIELSGVLIDRRSHLPNALTMGSSSCYDHNVLK